jgi:hypothetical protein
MNSLPVIYLNFANNEQSPLTALQKEDDKLHELLSPLSFQQHFLLDKESFTSREKITRSISQYKNNIVLFLYSGHADGESLFLSREIAYADGLAHLLAQCPNLHLVILNGCSTHGQVKALLKAGIPVVIATSAAVGDEKAKDFSIHFFRALSLGQSVGESFELAKGLILTQEKNLQIESRSLDIEAEEKYDPKEPLWGLFTREGEFEKVRKWKLPSKPINPLPTDFQLNESLIDTLFEALAPYNQKIQILKKFEMEGEAVDIGDKRLYILNSLPAPIAEQLRKLLVPPIDDDEKVFLNFSKERIKQLITTYDSLLQLLAFTLLAQLWEAKIRRPGDGIIFKAVKWYQGFFIAGR